MELDRSLIAGGPFQPLLAAECEAYCESLEIFNMRHLGSGKWNFQHEKIERMNMQAIVNATAQEHEFVKEFLIDESKYPLLVTDLIMTELWREKVFQKLITIKFEPNMTFPLYMVLYHEATVINILETTLFYQESCEACEDSVMDLVDFCHRKLLWLLSRSSQDEEESDKEDKYPELGPNMKELANHDDTIQFNVSLKALSVLRYICDHLSVLPLSCATRILNTLDFPVLLVELLQNSPWSRTTSKGVLEKFIDQKWTAVDNSDRFKITKIEGQIWLTLYKLLMDPECMKKYELNSHRKNTLLKLRQYLNEIMLDQLPILADLHRYLEHLSMMEPPSAKQDLILEQVPEIRERLEKEYADKWDRIAQFQLDNYFSPVGDFIREQASRWAEVYNIDVLEALLSEPPKCAVCGEPATKRCSRCQNEWYCRRECQVQAWKNHKSVCDVLQEAIKKKENDKKKEALKKKEAARKKDATKKQESSKRNK